MRMHHLGIATDDLEATAATYDALLDLTVVHEERFDGLEIAFLALEDGYLELLEPAESTGPIHAFLERRGPGIHHVAFAVDDIAETIAHLRDHDVEVIDDAPRRGAWGHTVAFVHPRAMGGVLIEFVEE